MKDKDKEELGEIRVSDYIELTPISEPQPGAIIPTFGQEQPIDYGLSPEEAEKIRFYNPSTQNHSLLSLNKNGDIKYPLIIPGENGSFDLENLGSIRRSKHNPITGLYY